ncbi:MFS transporter [Idiomarina sp. OT37-5b]|jgi:predicted MFS family arabinose efflux permease|uniref:MFS transporter n=1 Tax=Idiomarina sp. OT37-5b TaxID=2100422 RepID=UPI000CF99C7D|nr:MFS transporter [Idiomarina sp. OT37-5b]AVJ55055.1 MFS transporter [Idiomarina sp. OT37-5b]
MSQQTLNQTEKRAAVALASVFGIRMLGLFLIMPVLAIYARDYPDYSAFLMGATLGAYGLTQALLQIPMGMLSDRWGRRPVIILGLLVFILGSVVAAQADSLLGVAIGRAIQGLGAVAAAILALAADVSREQQRTKVMAIIGMCIGLAFAVAMVAGPLLGSWLGLAGIFWFTAATGVLGIVVLVASVPQVQTQTARRDALPVASELRSLLKHGQLWQLNVGVFVLHAVLTAWFITLPTQLQQAGFEPATHAWFYLPTLVASIAVMVPMIIRSSRTDNQVFWFRLALLMLCIGVALADMLGASAVVLVAALVIFFAGFNYLEASLPSLLTRIAPAGSKGSASGLYATSQFLGAFIGGSTGGWVLQTYQSTGLGILSLTLLGCWLVLTLWMKNPKAVTNVALNLGHLAETQRSELNQRLLQVTGVEEVRYASDDQISYLKVDKKQYDEETVQGLLQAHEPAK